jgi:hypothetical protein
MRTLSLIVALILHAPLALGQSATAPATQPDQRAAQQSFVNLPWAVQLGLRVHQVNQVFPLIDRVVLVPDAATYVDELSKWSPLGRWPVLIEDDRYAPMFVRRFKPAQLIRREAVDPSTFAIEVPAKQKRLEAIVTSTFGGDPQRQTIRESFAQQKYHPPGVVIASVNDPAWTAAVALAAGHGQPIGWLDDHFGDPDGELDADSTLRLIGAVDSLIAQQGYSFDALGDDIDAITLCRSIPGRTSYKPPSIPPPPVPEQFRNGSLAISDLIGRKSDGTRYAYTGWIFGDEKRCAYLAMCSLFLQRSDAVLHNSYPADEGWRVYSISDAAGTLKRAGFTAAQIDGANATIDNWERMIVSGVSADLFIMNTKGNNDYFELFSGKGLPGDVPVLNQPVALHLIHSWSMQAPANLDTIGGQWLDHGAYAAVGSCWEPVLQAFVPPSLLAIRLVNLVPFLIAARWWDGEPGIARPWRVVTIGDPLMVCPPIEHARKDRVSRAADDGVDLTEQVKTLMRQAPQDESGRSFAHALAILDMLGRDEIAVEFWKIAQQRGKQKIAARAALGPLFRTRNVEEFALAWDQIESPDPPAKDMLWHLIYPRLQPGTGGGDRDHVRRLQNAIRQPAPQRDIERLAPHVWRAFGEAGMREMIERELRTCRDPTARTALQLLLEQR